VPKDAFFDLIGQVVEENQTINKTALAVARYQVNNTIN
jgi:hypothetical protein